MYYNYSSSSSSSEEEECDADMDAYYKQMRDTDDDSKLLCIICDVNVPNTDFNVEQHVEGRPHTNYTNELLNFHCIRQLPEGTFCDCCDIWVSNFDHIYTDDHTYEYQTTYEIDKSLLRKYVYDEIDDHHNEAIMYRELYDNLLSTNEIIEIAPSAFYCEICEIKLSRVSEIDHMLGERHRLQIEEDDNE